MDDKSDRAVIIACRTLLRPVLRLLLKSGVSWKQFSDVARATLIDVATNEFGRRGRQTNVSRVAIATGINRRDVRRIRTTLSGEHEDDENYRSPARRLLSAWHQDPAYLDDNGLPAPLALSGGKPSFETLMRSYAGDVPPVALLKELMLVSAVTRLGDGRVQAIKRHYIPQQMDPAKTASGASAIADLGNSVEHNLTLGKGAAPRFERRASNDNIDPRHEAEFHAFLESEGMKFLERVDQWLTEHQAKSGAGIRLGTGVFHIQDDPKRGRPS